MKDSDTLIGQQIGNYRIIEKIARGGFGTVYQAQHNILRGRVVAIKFLHAPLQVEQERERFIMEAELLEGLKHPHILRIYDMGIHNDTIPYLITEYAPGGSLRERLKRQKKGFFPLIEAQTILAQVEQALYTAHQKKVVHRDLKPENILFNSNGEAILADFGISIVMEKVARPSLVGTPRYMAPEQFSGLVSPKSDQYALGCIAYELLTGHHPFVHSEESWQTWANIHKSQPPTPPLEYRVALPTYIERAILKALAKKPEERHNDVSEFIICLRETKEQWLKTGEVLLQTQRYDEALAAYDHAIELDPNYAIAYVDKALAFRQLQRYDEALAVCEHALQLKPDLAVAHLRRGIALWDLKRNDEALATFNEAVLLAPHDPSSYSWRGAALFRLQRYDEALASRQRAIQINPTSVIDLRGIGEALQKLKRFAEALTVYEQALYLKPDDGQALNQKGIILIRLKRYDEAMAVFNQLMKISPDHGFIHNNIGEIYYKQERYNEALEEYELSISLNPKSSITHCNKGNALRHLKRYDEALVALKQAAQLNPRFAPSHHHMGYLLEQLGHEEEAQIAYEKARQLGYTSDDDL